jgi:excisionase family DNA binding protein
MIDVGDEALDFLDIGEVATRMRVSKSTVRRLIASGDLEALRVGSRVLIAPEAVLEYKKRLRAEAQERASGRPAA